MSPPAMSSPQTLRWRVSPVLPAVKLTVAAALAGLGYTLGRPDGAQWLLIGVTVLGLAGWALRDVLAPVRLSADHTGVTVVTGLARRRHLPWAQIERIRLDRRERRGLRSELVEIDAGESLHLFGPHDLGAPPDEVVAALVALRSAAR